MLATNLQQLLSSTHTHLGAELTVRARLGRGLALQEYLSGGRPSARALIHLLSRTYGDDEVTLRSKLLKLSSLSSLFLERYGDGPVRVLRAPARINILGEHVDYVSYLPTASLPFGSREHDMIMLYRGAGTGRVRGASTVGGYAPFDFELGDGPGPGGGQDYTADWLSHLYQAPPPEPHWANYVKGSAYFARVKYGDRITRGYDFVVDSSIPPSGGASSSSALVVLAGAAVREVNRVRSGAAELALDSSKAEWYVGTRGGSMDHQTICLARRSHAVLISFREQRTRFLPLPGGRFRWVTFFSHPADKGREIMLEYNERAAVSRVLIPAIIEGWRFTDPPRHEAWERATGSLRSGSTEALRQAESLIGALPETITLAAFEQTFPEAFRECALAFPALVGERREHALRVRAYALHHLGEVRRVSAAESLLGDGARENTETERMDAAPSVGALLDESHASLRDLYGVSTPDVEELLGAIRSDPHVYGARLMGGGFGGNVLALTTVENLGALVDRVQAGFYGPRGRDGSREGSVMVSTPGGGLSPVSLDAVWREAVEEFNALGPAGAAGDRARLAGMLDEVTADAGPCEVWPVIVAAGKGSRARESGLGVPKPLAAVAGVPAVLRVLRSIRAAVGETRPPVVVVSPETEPGVREALAGEDVLFVTQPEAVGTGDAVWRAQELMKGFAGRALVVWSTQPVIRPRTMARALKLAALFDEFEMVLPTAHIKQPYAPVERDGRGRVLASRETHLEKAPRAAFGETNVGLFVLDCRTMFEALSDLRRQYWREAERRYDRPGGELGFPNEMTNYLAGRDSGVMACPLADEREVQGIKALEDVARCEQFIAELGERES